MKLILLIAIIALPACAPIGSLNKESTENRILDEFEKHCFGKTYSNNIDLARSQPLYRTRIPPSKIRLHVWENSCGIYFGAEESICHDIKSKFMNRYGYLEKSSSFAGSKKDVFLMKDGSSIIKLDHHCSRGYDNISIALEMDSNAPGFKRRTFATLDRLLGKNVEKNNASNKFQSIKETQKEEAEDYEVIREEKRRAEEKRQAKKRERELIQFQQYSNMINRSLQNSTQSQPSKNLREAIPQRSTNSTNSTSSTSKAKPYSTNSTKNPICYTGLSGDEPRNLSNKNTGVIDNKTYYEILNTERGWVVNKKYLSIIKDSGSHCDPPDSYNYWSTINEVLKERYPPDVGYNCTVTLNFNEAQRKAAKGNSMGWEHPSDCTD